MNEAMNPAPARMPVLVVDGRHHMRASGVLRTAGHPVECVSTGTEALTRTAERRFAVIVVARWLVDMDSLDLCLRLRSGGDWTPILVLSPDDSVDDRVRALDAGADDYAATYLVASEIVARVLALSRRRRPGPRVCGLR